MISNGQLLLFEKRFLFELTLHRTLLVCHVATVTGWMVGSLSQGKLVQVMKKTTNRSTVYW